MAITEIGAILSAAKTALDLGKKAKSLLPDGKDKREIERQLGVTEEELKLAEANHAKQLDYDLCQCTYPSQIMLYNNEQRATVCQNCGNTKSKKLTVAVLGGDDSRYRGF